MLDHQCHGAGHHVRTVGRELVGALTFLPALALGPIAVELSGSPF